MRVRILSGLLIAILSAVPAWAQSVNLNTVSKSGTISDNGGSVELTTAAVGGLGGGFGSVKVQTLDSYTGTWEVQCSVDGITYDTDSELKLTPTDSTTVAYSVSDTIGIWDVGNASACQSIRVIATAGFAASNVTVAIAATQSGGASGGGGASGSTDVSALNLETTQQSIASDINFIRLNLGVDCTHDAAACTAGPQITGFASAATPTAVSTDGDAARIWVDLNGRLHQTGEGIEDAGETAGGILQMAGSVRRDTAASSAGTTGDNATINTDAIGRLWITGTAIEDVAEAGADQLVAVGTVRRDTAASSAGTTGDFATLNTDSLGRLWITGAAVEDAGETAGGILNMVGTVRRDSAASSAGTDADNATLNTDALGRLWVRPANPCSDHARILSAVISETTAATNEIVALSGSNLIYVCGYKFVTTLANSLNWKYGTGADCGTGTTSIEGAQPYAANGGAIEEGGGAPIFIVPAGNALCLTSTVGTAHGGRVTYVSTAAP